MPPETPFSPPPPIALIDLMHGAALSQLVITVTRLGVADHLAEGPRSSAELAAALNVNASSLERVMRALEGFGLFELGSDGRYALNAVSHLLREGTPDSLRDHVLFTGSSEHLAAWGELEGAIRTGSSAFELAHGSNVFEFMRGRPALEGVFTRAMIQLSKLHIPSILEGYDFSGFDRVCDVGGGAGTFLAELLTTHGNVHGVLFDLESIVDRGRRYLEERNVADRCTFAPGNVFESVPEGCDAYVLLSVLHDWDDDAVVAILENVRRAMKPESRVLIIEMMFTRDMPRRYPGKLLDVEMHVLTGGRERTRDELDALLTRASLSPPRLIPLASPFRIAEARPA